MQSYPYRFCQVCGNPSLTQMTKRMKELALSGLSPNDPDYMGLISDMSKIANGEFSPCQCHPRAWAINQDLWWQK